MRVLAAMDPTEVATFTFLEERFVCLPQTTLELALAGCRSEHHGFAATAIQGPVAEGALA